MSPLSILSFARAVGERIALVSISLSLSLCLYMSRALDTHRYDESERVRASASYRRFKV